MRSQLTAMHSGTSGARGPSRSTVPVHSSGLPACGWPPIESTTSLVPAAGAADADRAEASASVSNVAVNSANRRAIKASLWNREYNLEACAPQLPSLHSWRSSSRVPNRRTFTCSTRISSRAARDTNTSPFELSPGVESVTISYSYSGDDGSSVIDLGLFEPGPLTLGTPAFRGYSGGAQRTITVGRNTASPGYKAGPLPAGLWHVMLGMYKVAPAGVDVKITITEAA